MLCVSKHDPLDFSTILATSVHDHCVPGMVQFSAASVIFCEEYGLQGHVCDSRSFHAEKFIACVQKVEVGPKKTKRGHAYNPLREERKIGRRFHFWQRNWKPTWVDC